MQEDVSLEIQKQRHSKFDGKMRSCTGKMSVTEYEGSVSDANSTHIAKM